jgi:2-polyprenyl-3-methyl-5-hydroxy-6-metoxy-1,4-benzoquinol methylase
MYTSEPMTAARLARIAKTIYTSGPKLTRSLQHWRPYICPIDMVIEEVAAGSFVLDVGCGGGLLLGALAHAKRISGGVGFDFSSSAIQVAHEMLGKLEPGHGLQFLHLSALDAWPEGPFTVVTMIDVLHHVPVDEQRAVFCHATRMLNAGSMLVYKDIAPRPKWRALANSVHDLVMARQWVHYVPMETLVAWAKEEGLVPLRCYTYNRLWYGHHFAIFVRQP